ncbi:hypothetical protein ANN_04912 [Periplaneta americana]|uniref:Uncharacterized protein n=1 Tax=Periplaneta americana TaxID=6978 RepID=A0ABQ8T9S1_PERAM|nr:hypothetical protein ANN_04912 [Periplaneta americana]
MSTGVVDETFGCNTDTPKPPKQHKQEIHTFGSKSRIYTTHLRKSTEHKQQNNTGETPLQLPPAPTTKLKHTNKTKYFLKSTLTNFPSCQELSGEIEDWDFSEFCENIEISIKKFDERFCDFENVKDKLLLFNAPLKMYVKNHP